MIHATVIGNLGSDAELKYTQNGKSVLNFSVASRGRTKEDPPTWVRGALWGQRAEKAAPYLTKGSRVAISGRLTTREHNGKTYVELDVQELELLGERSQGQQHAPAQQQRQRPAPPPEQDADPYGDDLPF